MRRTAIEPTTAVQVAFKSCKRDSWMGTECASTLCTTQWKKATRTLQTSARTSRSRAGRAACSVVVGRGPTYEEGRRVGGHTARAGCARADPLERRLLSNHRDAIGRARLCGASRVAVGGVRGVGIRRGV